MSNPNGQFMDQQRRMQEQQRRMREQQQQMLQDLQRRQKYAWYASQRQKNAGLNKSQSCEECGTRIGPFLNCFLCHKTFCLDHFSSEKIGSRGHHCTMKLIQTEKAVQIGKESVELNMSNKRDAGNCAVSNRGQTEEVKKSDLKKEPGSTDGEEQVGNSVLALLKHNAEKAYSFQEISNQLKIPRSPLQHVLMQLHEQKKVRVIIVEGLPHAIISGN